MDDENLQNDDARNRLVKHQRITACARAVYFEICVHRYMCASVHVTTGGSWIFRTSCMSLSPVKILARSPFQDLVEFGFLRTRTRQALQGKLIRPSESFVASFSSDASLDLCEKHSRALH